MHHLTVLSRQLDHVELQAKELFNDHLELYVAQFDNLRLVLGPSNYDVQISQYKQSLTDGALMGIGNCAKDLPKEEALTLDEATALYNDIEELKHAIQQAELDDALKGWLLELATEMQRALDEYEMRGGKAFEEAWSYLAGNMALRHEEFRSAKQQAPEVIRLAITTIKRLGEVASKTRVTTAATIVAAAMATGAAARIGERGADGLVDAVIEMIAGETQLGERLDHEPAQVAD
jgi:hypothetical protein